MNYLPVATIVEEWLALTGNTTRYKSIDIERRAVTTARRLAVPTHLQFKIDLIDVVGYKALLPDHFRKVVELAYGPPVDHKENKHQQYVAQLKSASIPCSWPDDGNCSYELKLECSKCSQRDCECEDRSFQVSYTDLSNAEKFARDNMQQPNFTIGVHSTVGPHEGRKVPVGHSQYVPEMKLMRPSTQTFGLVDSHVGGCLNLNKGVLAEDAPEYVIEGRTLRCNVPNGNIVIAYMSAPSDDDGMLLIPDQEDYIAAIVWDIEWHMLYKDVRSNRSGSSARGQLIGLADQQRRMYARRARSVALTPTPTEFEEVIQSEMMRHLPNVGGRMEFNKRKSDHMEAVMQRVSEMR